MGMKTKNWVKTCMTAQSNLFLGTQLQIVKVIIGGALVQIFEI